ncbi:MAG: response regulator transcription factor [Planctomycetes bacterium]|nr:response regulator transcription factor [Planctomycetota bacterium]
MRILLVDDHDIMREGLATLLQQAGHEIIGQARDGREGLRMAGKLTPDLVVMDIGMPGMNGVEATRQILALKPAPKVIALSMHADRSYVGNMLEAGARGYVLKECAFDELAHAIATVADGGVHMSGKIAGVVVGDYINRLGNKPPRASGELTKKEREVLQLVAEGKSTKEIAKTLFVTVKTIETHRQRIMNRLGIRSIAQLTKYAIRQGLTTLDS